jgi:hypothetical protein
MKLLRDDEREMVIGHDDERERVIGHDDERTGGVCTDQREGPLLNNKEPLGRGFAPTPGSNRAQ